MQAGFARSERRACALAGIERSSYRYRAHSPEPPGLRARLRRLAAERRRFGYRRLTVMRREGWAVNPQRVYRLYRTEGLAVRTKRRGQRAAGRARRLEQDLPDLLTFCRLPRHLWRKLRTTNVIERCFVEGRRPTRPMVCFVNVESVDRIIYAIFHGLHDPWRSRTLRIFT